MNVYENCPVLEDGKYLLRLVKAEDADDLLIGTNDRYAYNGYWTIKKDQTI